MIFLFLSFQFRAAVKKYAFLLSMPHGPLALVALLLPHLSRLFLVGTLIKFSTHDSVVTSMCSNRSRVAMELLISIVLGASPARTVEKTVTDRRERAQGAALLPFGSFSVGSTQL